MKKEMLFELVKSMSRGEKRHFSLQQKRMNGSKGYLKLFKLIELQNEYDEELIKKKFKGEKALNQFHVLKNYLREQIMKSLRSYHQDISIKSKIHMILIDVEVLFHKALYHQCNAEVKKAEDLAHSYNFNNGLLEIYMWKRKVAQAMNPFDVETIKHVVAQEEKSIDQVKHAFEKKQENVKIYSSFLGGPNFILAQPNRVSDLKSKENFEAYIYHQHSKYYQLVSQQKYAEAESELVKLLEYMENKPHYIVEDPGLYMATVNNVLGFKIFTKNYMETLQTISIVKTRINRLLKENINKIPIKELARINNIELEIYRDSSDNSIYRDSIDEIEKFVQTNELILNNSYLTLFWFQFASINFTSGEYNKALKWINKLLNMSSKIQRADILVYSRILNLMIHYELNNLMVLGYYIDGLKRFLQKQKLYNSWRKNLIMAFSKLRKAPMLDNKKIFKNLHQELFAENSKLIPDKNVLDYINIKSWVENKMK